MVRRVERRCIFRTHFGGGRPTAALHDLNLAATG